MLLFDLQIKNKPDNPQLYINKVVILAQVGMFKEAIVELEKIENKEIAIRRKNKIQSKKPNNVKRC